MTPDPLLVTIRYRNHRGEVADRRVVPSRLWFGSTSWHPESQWLLEAIDLDKGAVRDFAMRDILATLATDGFAIAPLSNRYVDGIEAELARLLALNANLVEACESVERSLRGQAVGAGQRGDLDMMTYWSRLADMLGTAANAARPSSGGPTP